MEISGFVRVNSVRVKHIHILEFVSTRSGLRVFLMQYESPVVNSYYVLPTRAENHEGLPHTLEHLIFLGSAGYPHRGTLDLLASRALSIGTNAWTSVDHTAYTISTAGVEGALKILPVYLDHILRPTLTEESFMTDVHRVTPDGSNSGTVYCEMKSHENSADNLSHFEMMDHLYPGDSGYKMNTGGRLDAIRTTSIERVRAYHKRFYRLDNLSIAICGNIGDHATILQVIAQAECDLIANGVEANAVDVPKFFGTKHWDDRIHCQELKDSSVSTVVFPSEDEETGHFTMAWRGPRWDDYELITAIGFMGSYLSDTPISPLQKELVHTDDPSGSSVDFALEDFRESYFSLTVQDVPCGSNGKMDTIKSNVRRILTEVHSKPLNMDRLRTIIRRERMSYLLALENSPHETAIDSVITYVTYSSTRADLGRLLMNDTVAEALMLKDETFWKNILWNHFLHSPTVCIRAVPSIERSREIERFERELVDRQLSENDVAKLRAREVIVDAIISNKHGGVPKHVVDAFKTADVSKLKLTEWPYIRNFCSSDADVDGGRVVHNRVQLFNEHGGSIRVYGWSEMAKELDKVDFPIQVNHIASDFIRLTVLVPTAPIGLSHFENKCLSLMCALLFVSDIVPSEGKIMSGDDFIRLLQQYTTSYGASLGIDSALGNPDSYAELLNVSITCHVKDYDKVFEILLHVLCDVRFNEKIMKAHAKAMLKTLTKKKRSAKALVLQASNAMRLRSNCVRMSTGLAQQLSFLKTAENGEIVNSLQNLYNKLFTESNIVVHMSCDINKMPEGWIQNWVSISSCHAVRGALTEHIGFKFGNDASFSAINGLFTSLASTDVSYFRFVIAAPLGHRHEEYTALCILSEYLSMMEGPMFRAIRGGGYAYNYNVTYFPSRGELHLTIQQATDLIGAIRASQELFRSIVNGEVITEDEIFAARCSLVFTILEEEETLADFSHDSFTATLRGVGSNFSKECLAKIQSTGVEDVRRVAVKYLSEFLSFGGSRKTMSIVTSRSQSRDVYAGLESLKYRDIRQVSVKSLLYFATTGLLDVFASDD